MKICYVSQYFPPETCAPAARVSELSRYFSESGHQVTVLTGFPNHPVGVLHPDYRPKFWRFVFRENTNQVETVRTFLLPLPNRKAHERILNYLSFFLSAAITGMFLRKLEVVIATSPQLLVGLAGCWLARWHGVPFVFEVRDLWPESLSVMKCDGPLNSFIYRAIGRLSSFLYRHADHIVVVTTAFKDHLVAEWKIDPRKISVVENGVETDIFAPQFNIKKEELGLADKFVVAYIGTLGLAHELKTLLDAAADLQASRPNVVFLLIGDGAEHQKLAHYASQLGLNNVRFLGSRRRELIPQYICAADVCLALLKKAAVFETVIPTKLLEFMSCGRPVIVGVRGQAQKIVEAANAGICVEPENSGQLANAIERLHCNPELAVRFGKNGRYYAVKNLSRRETALKYLRLLDSIVCGRKLDEADELAQAA